MRVIAGIILFLVTCATALLIWVNWDNIVDHFDNLIHPNEQTEQVPDDNNADDDTTLKENGVTLIDLD